MLVQVKKIERKNEKERQKLALAAAAARVSLTNSLVAPPANHPGSEESLQAGLAKRRTLQQYLAERWGAPSPDEEYEMEAYGDEGDSSDEFEDL